jgi:hypothetical protein
MAFGGSGSAGPPPEPDPRSAPAPASGQLAALQQAPAARAPGTLAPPLNSDRMPVMHAVSHEERTDPPAHDGTHIGYARGAHSQGIVTECVGYFGV